MRTIPRPSPSGGASAPGEDAHDAIDIIDDKHGYYHYYAHMQMPSTVSAGSVVTAGQLLGYLGDTGKARGTPPHLHYQVSRRNDRGMLQSFSNPYTDLFRLAARWQPDVSRGGRVVIPVTRGGPSGFG